MTNLAWIGSNGKIVTESQYAVLRAAECAPGTPAVARLENHHELVANGLQLAVTQAKAVGGGLLNSALREPRVVCSLGLVV